MEIQNYFSETGPIAQAKDGYESRPQQAEMAAAIEKNLKTGGILLTEAGTGVGKSFAYLVPAILHAQGNTKQRVVISTRTINLQEQLMRHDLPFLCDALPGDFRVELAQGGGNYLCLRKLYLAESSQMGLFENKREISDFHYLQKWARETKRGVRSEMKRRVSPGAWEAVSRDTVGCRRNCSHLKECFFRHARRRLESAEVIVVNHALLLSDLRLKMIESKILPDFNALIMDEAQHLEDIASDHLGLRVTRGRIAYLLNLLGFVAAEFKKGKSWRKTADQAAQAADNLFDGLRDRLRVGERERGRELFANVEDDLSAALKSVAGLMSDYSNAAPDEEELEVFSRLDAEFTACADDVQAILTQNLPDYIYWGCLVGGGGRETLEINATPAEVKGPLNAVLFDPLHSVVLTSATLTANNSFNYLKHRLGIESKNELLLGSPFDFKNQVVLRLRKDLPVPSHQDFLPQAAAAIETYLENNEGGAFILFTSYESLRRVYEQLADKLTGDVYVQGDDMERAEMLKRFRENGGVLFGTSSFWEGVDVPGQALSLVIIVKLPFAPPTSPVPKERMRRIDQAGGNSFNEYSLPQAVIRLRQGFGRLIRTKKDSGTVAMLDPRLLTKYYGKVFLNSLPECEVVIDGD